MAAFDALNIVDSLFAPTGFNPVDSSTRKQPSRDEDGFASALREVQAQNNARSAAEAAEQKLAQRRLEEQRAAREAASAKAPNASERADNARSSNASDEANEANERRDSNKPANAETFGTLISNLRSFIDEQAEAGTLVRNADGTVSIDQDILNGFSEDIQEQFADLSAYLESYQALAPTGSGFENGAGLPSDALELAESIQTSLQVGEGVSPDTVASTGETGDLPAATLIGGTLATGSALSGANANAEAATSSLTQQLASTTNTVGGVNTNVQASDADAASTPTARDAIDTEGADTQDASEAQASDTADTAEATDPNSASNTQAAQASAAAGRYTPNLNGNTATGSTFEGASSASTTSTSAVSSATSGQFSGQSSGQFSGSGGDTLGGQGQQDNAAAALARSSATPVQLTSDASQIITGTSFTRALASASLTPESITDWTADSRQASISGGLSSLRGEPSLLNQGLLGGQPSRNVAQQAARQVNLAVTKAVQGGKSEFTVRLNPEELGRVTVRLQFSEDGTVKAQVLAQKPETLELLQKDKGGLEKAIAAGGNALDGDGLSFSLDDDGKSTGRAFADALLEDRVNEQHAALKAQGSSAKANGAEDLGADLLAENEIPLEDILPFVTAETGLDIRI